MGLVVSQPVARRRVARQGTDLDLGVLQQQSQHLASRVSRASRDGNLETHNGNYAIE